MALGPRLPRLDDLSAFMSAFELRTVSRWVGLGLLVGVGAGLAAAGFYLAVDWVTHLVLDRAAGLPRLEPGGERSWFVDGASGPVRPWMLVVAPALGGLVSGLLSFKIAPVEGGHGNDAVIEAFHWGRGRIRPRVPLIKGLASVVLIGTGGSAGREGPIAHIGAGFGSVLGAWLRLSDRERRLLVLAGAAGGIGAIFRTPLGAALFVVEVLYRDDFEVEALVPTVLSSVVAYSVFTAIFGQGAMFETAGSYPFDPRQLPLYLVMAVAASIVGVLFIKVFHVARDRVFAAVPLPRFLVPMVGGLLVGVLALFVPQALGAGYGWLQAALSARAGTTASLPAGWIGAATLLGIALAKVVTTSLSVGSGGSGGVFGPSVVIGGMLGGAFGLAFHQLAPQVVPVPGAFVIVGMACFVGGVAHAPISTLVMASEMTGSYELLVPIMLAEAVTFIMMRRWTVYQKQVPSRRESPAHGGEYVLDVLQDLRVGDVYRHDRSVRSVSASTPLPQLLQEATESKQAVFPVLGDDGRIQGLVSLETLREFFYDEHIGRVAIAADCAVAFEPLAMDDSLGAALEHFGSSKCSELPVRSSSGDILGWLGYEDLLRAYRAELVRRRLGVESNAE